MIAISADVEKVTEALRETSLNWKTIQRKCLSTIGRELRKSIKSNIAMTTTRRTGELSNAYMYKAKFDGTKLSVFPASRRSSETFSRVSKYQNSRAKTRFPLFAKVYGLNSGSVIMTASRKVHHVLYPRNFVQKAQSQYVDSGRYQLDLEALINEELKKYWG